MDNETKSSIQYVRECNELKFILRLYIKIIVYMSSELRGYVLNLLSSKNRNILCSGCRELFPPKPRSRPSSPTTQGKTAHSLCGVRRAQRNFYYLNLLKFSNDFFFYVLDISAIN